MSREIMQQALHHLVDLADDLRRIPSDIAQTISALEAELAKPEQIITPISPDQYERFCGKCGACLGKPWVGLTQEDRDELLNYSTSVPSRLIDWTEEKLKEKNT